MTAIGSTAGRIVIVGASHAGIALAVELRSLGCGAPLLVLDEEEGLPYHRPHLSKECLAATAVEPGLLRPAKFFEDRLIELRPGVTVVAIDRDVRALQLKQGERIPYDRLILATGAYGRSLPSSIAGGRRAYVLRGRADGKSLAERLSKAGDIAVIGGGLIGLEVAAAAALRGARVQVFEAADRLMARSLYPELSHIVLNRHLAQGIQIRLGARFQEISERELVLPDGERIAADLVVAAVGSSPRDELARDAGLPTEDGVLVDASGQTGDPSIFALGDCARWLEDGRHVRHESVPAAQWQARCVAARLMGQRLPAPAPLRLWSTQGSMRLQMAGPVVAGAQVTLEEEAGGGVLLRAFSAGRLVAVQALDAPRRFNALLAELGTSRGDP